MTCSRLPVLGTFPARMRPDSAQNPHTEPGTIKHIHSPTAEGCCGELTSEKKDGDQPKAEARQRCHVGLSPSPRRRQTGPMSQDTVL